jgi:hypothetical protein
MIAGADLAMALLVPPRRRLIATVRSVCAGWLVLLSASPFTAPFRTCDISTLFGGAPISSTHAGPTSSKETASTDVSQQPSLLVAITARVKRAPAPLLMIRGERPVLIVPAATSVAPSSRLPLHGFRPSEQPVLRL